MDTLDAIYQRRAVKHFDPDHTMPEADLAKLLDAAVQSPTSFNMQNWRIVVLRDPELRAQCKAAAMGQAQVSDASVLLLLTADLKAWAKSPERYWRNAPKPIAELLVNWMGPFYDGKEQLQRDEAMRSCGIVGQTLMLAAKAMGYDTCPMIGFDSEQVAELIRLPEDHVIGMMVVVGKATKPALPKPGQLPIEEVIVYERFD